MTNEFQTSLPERLVIARLLEMPQRPTGDNLLLLLVVASRVAGAAFKVVQSRARARASHRAWARTEFGPDERLEDKHASAPIVDCFDSKQPNATIGRSDLATDLDFDSLASLTLYGVANTKRARRASLRPSEQPHHGHDHQSMSKRAPTTTDYKSDTSTQTGVRRPPASLLIRSAQLN